MTNFLEGSHLNTTFGVGRNAFKKVVSQTCRNYGDGTEDVPGPGVYDPKNAADIAPVGGTFSCTV